MNVPFLPPVATFDGHESALVWAKQWRSDCIDHFAELEATIADVLESLAARRKLGVKVKTGLLFRPAFDELMRLTGPKGSFVKECCNIPISLAELNRQLDWRAHLTHGTLDVWQGRKGVWLITLRHREVNSGGPVRWFAIPRAEAERICAELETEVRKLKQRASAMLGKSIRESD